MRGSSTSFLGIFISCVTRVNKSALFREELLLALIILAGATLRLCDLGSKDLWSDEAQLLLRSLQSVPDIMVDAFQKIYPDPYPVLYPLCLHFWTKLGVILEERLSAIPVVLPSGKKLRSS